MYGYSHGQLCMISHGQLCMVTVMDSCVWLQSWTAVYGYSHGQLVTGPHSQIDTSDIVTPLTVLSVQFCFCRMCILMTFVSFSC